MMVVLVIFKGIRVYDIDTFFVRRVKYGRFTSVFLARLSSLLIKLFVGLLRSLEIFLFLYFSDLFQEYVTLLKGLFDIII